MNADALRREAIDRLEGKFDRMGIVAPDEQFSQAELADMYADELQQAYHDDEEHSFLGPLF